MTTITMIKPEVRHSIACPPTAPWIVEEDDIPTPTSNTTSVWYDPDKRSSPQLPPAIMMTSCEVKKVRRKSWHAIRFERKRKKGVVEAANVAPVAEQLMVAAAQEDNNNSEDTDVELGPLPPPRQKRLSWWNIFANQPRSRRASQDMNAGLRSTENFPIWTRSKSRSVDHGISAPFDINVLRSKVDGHVEKHIDRDIDGSTNSLSERKKAGPPENTITYTVADRDTLTSVAARFDTTPSELTKLNRLATPFIFPGQQLYVPLRASGEEGSDSSTPIGGSREKNRDELPPEEKELLDNLRPVSPKPGHAERVRTPSGGTYPALSSSLDSNHSQQSFINAAVPPRVAPGGVPTRGSSIYKQFLKINVRHITDGQGVVGGVLLVTHNAVMFDPNVSDALVIEHGPEAYGVIAPMEFVVNAAIYSDIAHMRVGHVDHSKLLHHSDSNGEKPEIYYPKSEREPPEPPEHHSSLVETDMDTPTEADGGADDGEKTVDSLLVKDETFPELGTSIICGNDDTESVCSCTEREGDAFPKAFDRDLVTPTNIEDLEGGHSGGVTPQLQTPRTAEERRKSLLDHHWAIPSRDRSSVDVDELLPTAANANISPGPASNTSADDQQDDDLIINISAKPSCHDSGIDIHDAGLLPVVPVQTKKVYSDADIVLSREWVPPITIPPTQVVTSIDGGWTGGLSSSIINNGGSPARKKTSSVSFTIDNSVEEILEEEGEETAERKEENKGAQGETKKNKMLKRLSYPMSWIETFSGDNKDGDDKNAQPRSADAAGQHPGHTSSMFSKVFSRRSSVGTFIRQPTEGSKNNKQTAVPQPKLDYKSMVSVEDMPELFVSFDKLIPRPARSCEDPPLYLRLRMGKPVGRPIPHSTPLMSYGKKKMRPEYWFSIPRNRVDELYNFINSWVPHLYGELNEEHVTMRGYCLVEADTELWSDEPTPSASRHGSQDGDIADISRESWEVLPMSEDLRRALYSTGTPGASLDIDLTPPDLIGGVTEVLTYAHRESLCRHLPARAEGYVWTLAFSTSRDGFSLNSMYRKMHKLESPVLMVIMDTDNNVFGALTSCALQVSDHFYGTGESLLYRFTPQFQVFNWTGENLYFIKGNNESLSIGAGDGKFGLWLDGDLYQGRTESCQTYSNEPLTPNVDFVVKTLECWVFI